MESPVQHSIERPLQPWTLLGLYRGVRKRTNPVVEATAEPGLQPGHRSVLLPLVLDPRQSPGAGVLRQDGQGEVMLHLHLLAKG